MYMICITAWGAGKVPKQFYSTFLLRAIQGRYKKQQQKHLSNFMQPFIIFDIWSVVLTFYI